MTGSFSNFDPAAPGRLLYYSSFYIVYCKPFQCSIPGTPFRGSAKNVAKVESIFETCKFFRNFFFRSPAGTLHPRPGSPRPRRELVPESECEGTQSRRTLQIFRRKYFQKACFLTYSESTAAPADGIATASSHREAAGSQRKRHGRRRKQPRTTEMHLNNPTTNIKISINMKSAILRFGFTDKFSTIHRKKSSSEKKFLYSQNEIVRL